MDGVLRVIIRGVIVDKELSEPVVERIYQLFKQSEYATVCSLLHQYGGREKERIHLDILQLCEGKVERITKLIEMANTDYRDVIVAAEYELRNGKLVKKA